ncbi:MAG: hypothetical protein ACRDRE_26290, partial [Pseudonocardiaceae bacterium]
VLGALLAAGLEPATAAAAAVHAQELAAAIAARDGESGIGVRGGGSGIVVRGGMCGGAPAPASAIQKALTDAVRTLRAAARLPDMRG